MTRITGLTFPGCADVPIQFFEALYELDIGGTGIEPVQ